METVFTIIAVIAVIGGLIGYFGGGRKVGDAAAGAGASAMMAGGCLFELLIYGAMALAGLWLVKVIFFESDKYTLNKTYDFKEKNLCIIFLNF